MSSSIEAARSYVYANLVAPLIEAKDLYFKERKVRLTAHEMTPLHSKIQDLFGGKEKFYQLPHLKIREPKVEKIDFIKNQNMPACVMRAVDPYGREFILLKLRSNGTTTHPRNIFVVSLFPLFDKEKSSNWSAATSYTSHCDVHEFIKDKEEDLIHLISQIAIQKNHPQYVLADTPEEANPYLQIEPSNPVSN